MCKAMEDMRSETARETAHAKAVAIARNLLAIGKLTYDARETAYAKAVAVARNLLAIGKLTYEEIAQSVDLTVDEVKSLDSQKTA